MQGGMRTRVERNALQANCFSAMQARAGSSVRPGAELAHRMTLKNGKPIWRCRTAEWAYRPFVHTGALRCTIASESANCTRSRHRANLHAHPCILRQKVVLQLRLASARQVAGLFGVWAAGLFGRWRHCSRSQPPELRERSLFAFLAPQCDCPLIETAIADACTLAWCWAMAVGINVTSSFLLLWV